MSEQWLRTLVPTLVLVSNSFHGVVLRLLFNQHFIAVDIPGKRADMNDLVQILLTTAGLTERIDETTNAAIVCALADASIY